MSKAMPGGLQPLVEIIHAPSEEAWNERNRFAFEALFGTPAGRYRAAAKSVVTLRAPEFRSE